jgi:hypothetical protein
MTPTWQSAALALVSDLRSIFGDRLHAVVAYGPHLDGRTDAPLTCLALVGDLTANDLDGCARAASHWTRQGLATPLVLPRAEFRSSLDAFPLEYGEIIRTHQRVYGEDPFAGVTIAPADVRRACETQAKSHLLHLRESYIEAGGRPSVVADLVAASAPAFTALLRHVARLSGSTATEHAQATREGARAAGVDDRIAGDLLSLELGSPVPTTDAARLFPGYLAAVEQLARAIDAWRVA